MGLRFTGTKIGTVVAVYPEGNSIDVYMSKTGDRLANVQCAAHTGSSSSGVMDLPEIGLPVDDTRWNPQIINTATRQVRAIIQNIDGMPVCMGFLLPQITQMTFKRDNFRVHRHASDVYSTTNGNGDHEWYHPSGTFLRVAASPAHEDLTQQDVDKSWAIQQNVNTAPYVNLVVANAGAQVANIEVDPSGNITITHNGNLTVNAKGNAAVTVGGTTELDSSGNVTIKAPQTTVEGPLTVTGPFAFQSGMTGSGGSGAVVQIDGSISSTGDQVAGGISQMGHKHTSESPGTPTSTPIAS